MAGIDGVDASNVHWCRPTQATGVGVGVVVVAGSSGAIPIERAALLADHGAHAVAIRWFGGLGQPARPVGVELELFEAALESLAVHVDRIAILGASFGAEAALSVAARVPIADVTIAVSPTRYVWPGMSDDGVPTSHWTWRGEAVPFVPFASAWEPDDDPPSFRSLYELSAASAPDAARIPCERIAGNVVLVAGGDDRVWPSDRWADAIADERAASGLPTDVITRSDAGHRPIFPGEHPPADGIPMQRGGNPAADAALGTEAWTRITSALELR